MSKSSSRWYENEKMRNLDLREVRPESVVQIGITVPKVILTIVELSLSVFKVHWSIALKYLIVP